MNNTIRKLAKRFSRDSIVYRLAYSIYTVPLRWFSKYGYIYNYIIFPIQGFFRVHHIRPFYNSNTIDLEKYRGVHEGKRCFIIATGPSLRVEDIEALENEYTIGVNSLYRLYDKTIFRPNYYVCLDLDVQENVIRYLKTNNDICKETVFLNPQIKCRDEKVEYIPICYQNHWFKIYDANYDHSKNLKYSVDLLYGIYDKYTITNAAIDLAIFMGFKEIYLIGVDCSYYGKNNYAFKPETTNPILDDRKKELTHRASIKAYRFMDSEAKKHGIIIKNVTRGGMLEEFERINLEDIIV